MYRRILLLLDRSGLGTKALEACLEIGDPGRTEVLVLAVTPEHWSIDPVYGEIIGSEYEERRQTETQECAVAWQHRLATAGFASWIHMATGDVVAHVIGVATQAACDLVLMGHRPRQGVLERILAAPVSIPVVDRCPCHVLFVVDRPA